MLTLTVPPNEMWDSVKQEFVNFKGETLFLEHSLLSVSKWESEFCKPFLSKTEKSIEEMRAYIKCMTLNKSVDPQTYKMLTNDNFSAVMKYIDSPMSAVKFKEQPGKGPMSRETITSELIYYWLVALQIPFQCEKWHLNRLFTLVRICSIKNKPATKRSKSELARERTALNKERKARLHTTG